MVLKRRSTDLAQCLCIVDGFFAFCLFAELVLLMFRMMQGGSWLDIFAYILFLVVASCGIVFCCACVARTLQSLKIQLQSEQATSLETESIMQKTQDGEEAEESRSEVQLHASNNLVAKAATEPSATLLKQGPEAEHVCLTTTPQVFSSLGAVVQTFGTVTPGDAPEKNSAPRQAFEKAVAPTAVGNATVDVGVHRTYEVEEDASPLPILASAVESTCESRQHALDHL
jgi:hypothetical protein